MNIQPGRREPQSATARNDACADHPMVRTLLTMAEAPDDAPDILAAHAGITHALNALADRQPAARHFAGQMGQIPHADLMSAQAPSSSVVPLLSRRGRLTTWAMLREIGRAALNLPLPLSASDALATLGAALLRSLLTGRPAQAKLVTQVRNAVVRPQSAAAENWSDKARARSLSSQLHLLEQALLDHPVAARQLGLAPPAPGLHATPSSPAAALNAAIKRRVTAVEVYAPASLTRASDGHNSLSAASIAVSGRHLRAGAMAGDDVALMMCMELLTNMTPKVLVMLPLSRADDESGVAPLAWIDIEAGTYSHIAWWLRERGARPEPGTRDLYVQATDIVSVRLPGFLQQILLSRLATAPGAKTVGGLCEDGQHHPWRATDQGSGGYRVSVRRLHSGVVSHLVEQGLGRLPVALITRCHNLISKGRVAYGLVPHGQFNAAAAQMYRCLDWGDPVESPSPPDLYYGSAVTPTDEAVRRAFASLAEQVDTANEALDPNTPESARRLLNALHAWLGALMALALALRNSTEYPLLARDLQQASVHVDDKRVHALGPGPALPVLLLLRAAMTGVEQRCASVAASLAAIDAAHPIHAAAEALLGPDRPALQRITSSWAAEAGGTDTWRQALPSVLRLVPNFGRHFWPHRLAARGIGQADLDVLLRHSANDIESTSTSTTTPPRYRHRRLVSAMEAELASLRLAQPRCLA